MLTAAGIAVTYGTRTALAPLDATLAAGQLVALVGPNGAGKSSLLKALAGLVPSAGRASWNAQDLGRMAPRQRARLVAYLPQAGSAHWPLRVRELVALGRLPHRAFGVQPQAADEEAVDAAMAAADVAGFASRSVAELSNGERARVLLARALAVDAPVLLVDEPIAMLDPYHQLTIMTVLERYAARHEERAPRLVVAVLHDLGLAARFCARVLMLDRGKLVVDAGPAEALTDAALRRHYRIEALLSRHAGEALVVPWRALDGG